MDDVVRLSVLTPTYVADVIYSTQQFAFEIHLLGIGFFVLGFMIWMWVPTIPGKLVSSCSDFAIWFFFLNIWELHIL